MNKKKKILLSLSALVVALALIVSGTFAFFIVYETTNDNAKVGEVSLKVSPLTVGHNKTYEIIDGKETTINRSDSSSSIKKNLTSVTLNTYSYTGTSVSDIPCEYWIYSSNSTLLNDVYFRTGTGSVAYCVDSGKNATDAKFDDNGYSIENKGTTKLQETTPVSDDVKRVLKVGYPNVDYSEYRNAYSNVELEWATSVAIYIAEASAYHHDGSLWQEGIIRLDKMDLENLDNDALLIPTALKYPAASDELTQASIENSARLKQLVADILERAEQVINVPTFYLDDTYAINEPQYNTEGKLLGYKVGPFILDNNIGKATFTVTNKNGQIISDSTGVVFQNNAGVAFSSLQTTYEDPFYVFIPTSYKNEDLTITASVEGGDYLNYPMYYYWDGNSQNQKMISCELMTPKASVTISKSMYDDYTYWNPGDVLTVKWTVENSGNKSVVTRNIVSIYWKNNDMSKYANQKDIVYLYPENTSASEIFADQFPATKMDLEKDPTAAANRDFRKTPTLYKTACMSTCSYKQLGSMSKVTVAGKDYNAGYSFIVYGDALDGTGSGVETGNAYEVNYGSQYDETLAHLDEVAFKLCLGSIANIHTMGEELVIRVETQAMQYRNTSDAEWNTLFGPTETTDSYWKTVATNEYVIGTGNVSTNDPMK